MQKLRYVLGAFAIAAAPALAQTQPAQGQPAPAETPKTVQKTVCQVVHEEPLPGSMVGTSTKVCKTVEVPATGDSHQAGKQAEGN